MSAYKLHASTMYSYGTALPDDQSRIVQNHPRLDTVEQRRLNAAKVWVGIGSGVGRSVYMRGFHRIGDLDRM